MLQVTTSFVNKSRSAGCCMLKRSLGRPSSCYDLCSYIDEKLDLLLLTETWRECSDSVVLKNVTPSGYKYLDAPRPLPPGRNFQTLNVQNYGGLALIHRSGIITVTQRQLGISPTTFEYLCGFVKTSQKNFLLLGVYTDLQAREPPQRSLTNYLLCWMRYAFYNVQLFSAEILISM